MKIQENIPISSLTTMRLGGPARYVIDIEQESDIKEAYDFAKSHNLPVFILGGGANTIGHDEGFDGAIIRNALISIEEQPDSIDLRPSATNGERNERSEPRNDGRERARRESTESGCNTIKVLGGTVWDDVVAFACDRGLTGIEALSKIPGLASAAPVQNIGAYGQEIADTLVEIRVYDTHDNQIKILSKDELHFSYRHSILNTTEIGRYFVISITLALEKGEMPRPFYNSIERYIAANNCTDFSPAGIRKIVSTIRADKLPDPKEKASSGSFFKNIYLTEEEAKLAESKGYPVYHGHDGFKINSGWLIEEAGLKGKLLHGMRVSSTAALVLINESAKSYNDLSAARAEIINAVYDKFGYKLEQEPVEIQ